MHYAPPMFVIFFLKIRFKVDFVFQTSKSNAVHHPTVVITTSNSILFLDIRASLNLNIFLVKKK
jgi:hypothetical protein